MPATRAAECTCMSHEAGDEEYCRRHSPQRPPPGRTPWSWGPTARIRLPVPVQSCPVLYRSVRDVHNGYVSERQSRFLLRCTRGARSAISATSGPSRHFIIPHSHRPDSGLRGQLMRMCCTIPVCGMWPPIRAAVTDAKKSRNCHSVRSTLRSRLPSRGRERRDAHPPGLPAVYASLCERRQSGSAFFQVADLLAALSSRKWAPGAQDFMSAIFVRLGARAFHADSRAPGCKPRTQP
jgi:hypothetical protein